MYPLVEYPELVKHYAHFFEKVFSAAFIEFERYISGLIVSENKTVEGINRLFVNESRNQSSLNRLLTESPFSLEELNQVRLGMLASLAGTAIKPYRLSKKTPAEFISGRRDLPLVFSHHFPIQLAMDHTQRAHLLRSMIR